MHIRYIRLSHLGHCHLSNKLVPFSSSCLSTVHCNMENQGSLEHVSWIASLPIWNPPVASGTVRAKGNSFPCPCRPLSDLRVSVRPQCLPFFLLLHTENFLGFSETRILWLHRAFKFTVTPSWAGGSSGIWQFALSLVLVTFTSSGRASTDYSYTASSLLAPELSVTHSSSPVSFTVSILPKLYHMQLSFHPGLHTPPKNINSSGHSRYPWAPSCPSV